MARSVSHNLLKGRKVSLPCSYLSTCFVTRVRMRPGGNNSTIREAGLRRDPLLALRIPQQTDMDLMFQAGNVEKGSVNIRQDIGCMGRAAHMTRFADHRLNCDFV